MKYSERCCECGSWELECGSDKPVKDCACVRCLSHTNKLLQEEIKQLKNKLPISSKWYNCAKCDALYEDQECTCAPHTKECGWHKDWHNCTCGAFNKLIVSATFHKVKQQIIVTKSDNKTVAIPLSWFTPSGTGLKPDPENIKVIDDGQTLALGEYETAVDYMLENWDKL